MVWLEWRNWSRGMTGRPVLSVLFPFFACSSQESPCCSLLLGNGKCPSLSTLTSTIWLGRCPLVTRHLCSVWWKSTQSGPCWRGRLSGWLTRMVGLQTYGWGWTSSRERPREPHEPFTAHSGVWEAHGALWATGRAGCWQGRDEGLTDPAWTGFHSCHATQEAERLQWGLENEGCPCQVSSFLLLYPLELPISFRVECLLQWNCLE